MIKSAEKILSDLLERRVPRLDVMEKTDLGDKPVEIEAAIEGRTAAMIGNDKDGSIRRDLLHDPGDCVVQPLIDAKDSVAELLGHACIMIVMGRIHVLPEMMLDCV